MNPWDVLLISGLPGAGKTCYAAWLALRGWGRMEFDKGDAVVVRVLNEAVGGSDEPLLSVARKYSAGLVVEWGFDTRNLPQLRAMVKRGYNAWYFDGDRDAALQSWMKAHPGMDVSLWHRQVQALDARWSEICGLYQSRIITTVGPGPHHLPEEEIRQLMGLPDRQVE